MYESRNFSKQNRRLSAGFQYNQMHKSYFRKYGKCGYLFKNNDPIDLTNLIVMLMQKDYNSIKSIGFEGRKNVLKKFDVDKMCQSTFTEYKKLIELS